MKSNDDFTDSDEWSIKGKKEQNSVCETYDKGYLLEEITERIYYFAEQDLLKFESIELLANYKPLGVEETVNNFQKYFKKTLNGSDEYAISSYMMLPDNHTKLLFALNLWDWQLKVKNFPKIWSAILKLVWVGGNSGSLLMQANISKELLVKMFEIADKKFLMNNKDLIFYEGLHDLVEVWRGVSEFTQFGWNGISWSTNYKQAKWFALRNIQNQEKAHLLHGFVNKSNILAAFSNEWEIVVNPVNDAIQTIDFKVCENSEKLMMSELSEQIRTDKSIVT